MTRDVVIVGAGPVGLFLACELRLAGSSVTVLERERDPQSPLKQAPFGLRGLSVATQQALDRRGLLTGVLTGAPAEFDRDRVRAGHFAGIALDYDHVDVTTWESRMASPVMAGMVAVTMQHLEEVLARRATDLGVEIVRGVGVDGVDQSPDGVVARASGRTFSARWLVGCDGGRSVVRKLGGFEFTGTPPTFTGYSVHVELTAGQSVPLGRHYTEHGMYMQPAPGAFSLADFDGGAFHRSGPVTKPHVTDVLRRVTGHDVTVEALEVASTWTDRTQQVTSYRRGRVLLAGDAAHIHSPLGGQGLNLGLGDAMNLGWRLGAVGAGVAPDDLLNGYHAERHPVGREVLDGSRAQVVLLRPDPGSRALAGILRDLVDTDDGATYFAERMWGLDIRYDLGGQHPLVGRSAPDFELADGSRLGVVLRDGRGVLVDFDGRGALGSITREVGDVLHRVRGTARHPLGLTGALVRPDGVVAWACDGEPDLDHLARALSRCGYDRR